MSKWDKLIIRICNLSKTFGLMNCERYWKVTDMKCMHREVEAAIILSEKKAVCQSQYRSMNQSGKYMWKW